MVLRNKASQVTKENICFVVRPTQPAYKFSTGKTCSHEHRDGLAQLFIHPRKKGEPNLKKKKKHCCCYLKKKNNQSQFNLINRKEIKYEQFTYDIFAI